MALDMDADTLKKREFEAKTIVGDLGSASPATTASWCWCAGRFAVRDRRGERSERRPVEGGG